MVLAVTKLLKRRMQESFFRGDAAPSTFYLALVYTEPTVDSQLFSELDQIATGSNYPDGGLEIARDVTGFDNLVVNAGVVTVYLEDIIYGAIGGTIPPSGSSPTFAVLIGDNATPANREVYAWFSLGGSRTITSGQSMTLTNARLFLVDS